VQPSLAQGPDIGRQNCLTPEVPSRATVIDRDRERQMPRTYEFIEWGALEVPIVGISPTNWMDLRVASQLSV
jgi:hypothetical protein